MVRATWNRSPCAYQRKSRIARPAVWCLFKLAEIFPWQHLVLAELPDDSPKPGALVAAFLFTDATPPGRR